MGRKERTTRRHVILILLLVLLLVLLWVVLVSNIMMQHYTDYRTLEFRGHRLQLEYVDYSGVSLTDESGMQMQMFYNHFSLKNVMLSIRYRSTLIRYRFSQPAPEDESKLTFSDGSTLPAEWGGAIIWSFPEVIDDKYEGLQREELTLMRSLFTYYTQGYWPDIEKWPPIYIAGVSSVLLAGIVLISLAFVGGAYRMRKKQGLGLDDKVSAERG